MNLVFTEALRFIPSDIWRIALIGVIMLLVLVACVPGAGDRLINFFQQGWQLFHPQLHMKKPVQASKILRRRQGRK